MNGYDVEGIYIVRLIKTAKLKEHYIPIERAGIMDSLVEWWEQSHESLITHGNVRPEIIMNAVREAIDKNPGCFRDGTKRLLDLLLVRIQVPVLIVSAGIGNVIEQMLKSIIEPLNNDVISIIANYIEFDDDGRACGFNGPMLLDKRGGLTFIHN